MANWQVRLDIRPIIKLADEDWTNINEVAHKLGEYFSENMKPRDYLNKAGLGKACRELIEFDANSYGSHAEVVFNDIMSEIYDIADDELIWIESLVF